MYIVTATSEKKNKVTSERIQNVFICKNFERAIKWINKHLAWGAEINRYEAYEIKNKDTQEINKTIQEKVQETVDIYNDVQKQKIIKEEICRLNLEIKIEKTEF